MKFFLRPNHTMLRSFGRSPLLGGALLGAACIAGGHMGTAQSSGFMRVLKEPRLLLHSSSSQGYMGVLVGDLDADAAAKLKLKDTHGAVITLIDHDAPASEAGIHVNDVVLQVNGQPVE